MFAKNNLHRSATRKLTALIFILLLSLATFAGAAEIIKQTPAKVLAQYGRGKLLEINDQKVLLLAGSNYEMGYQHGKLLQKEVKALVERVLFIVRAAEATQAKPFLKPGSIENAFERTKSFIDERYFEEMQGIADGSGVPLRDVHLANVFPELFHCSGFALFGDATKGQKLLHGRILDYMTEAGIQEYALLTVAKPTGYNNYVTVGFAGLVGSVTCMNDKQVALGEMGGSGEGSWDGMPMTFLMRKAAEEADHLQQAVDIFKNTKRTCEYYYVISDGKIPDGRGLACTSEKCDVLKSNESHPQLPHAIKDVVLMSAGDRYEHLARLVKENFGEIDVDYALDLMNRPVAMKDCLHRVLFSPQDLKLWVANAVMPEETEQFAACYRPYYEYDFKKLLTMIPETTPTGIEKVPAYIKKETATQQSAQPKIPDVIATVPSDIKRRYPVSTDNHIQQMLSPYRFKNEAFEYKIKFQANTPAYDILKISFPSALKTDIEQNNTVYCEYFRAKGNQKRASVILLDILEGSLTVSRLIAHSLASSGIDGCIMTLPHYGPRRMPDDNLIEFMKDPNVFVASVQQAVMDVRRTARWIESQPQKEKNRIGLCGTSLGGFIAALSGGVDGGFNKIALVLAGADMPAVLTTDAKEVQDIKAHLALMNISGEKLSALLEPIEPLTFADRLKKSKILMINGSLDTIVPPACAQKLAKATGAEICWFNTDHYGMSKYLLIALGKVNTHFSGDKW